MNRFLFIMMECAIPAGLVTDGTMYWDFYNLAGDVDFWLIIPLSNLFATTCNTTLISCVVQPHWDPACLHTSTGATTETIHHLQT